MTYEQIISDLKNKKYKPIYFLSGEEPYYIDKISDFISNNVLTETEKAFNQTIVYGKDTDVNNLITLARRFPMMANQQVIIIKEAQELKDFDTLIHYVEKPLKSTILVINYKYKKPDSRKKIFKTINEKGFNFNSKKLYDNQVPDWILNYVKSKGYTIEINSTMLLNEYLGNNLSKIVNEINKLIIALPEGNKHITSQLIERYIGISKEYNNFELQKALIQKNANKAYKIVNYFGQNQKNNPFPLTIITLYNFFSKVLTWYFIKDKSPKNMASKLKVHSFYLKDYETGARQYNPSKLVEIIGYLKQYDLKSKGVGNTSIPHGELLKELVSKILN